MTDQDQEAVALSVAQLTTTAAATAETVVNTAAGVAKVVVDTATNVAEAQQKNTVYALSEALRQVFGENQDSGRFINVSRIPMICSSIISIHKNIEEIKERLNSDYYVNKDQFTPVRIIAFGAAGLILVGFFTTIVTFFLRQ